MRQGVAGAALLDEQLLAGHEVGRRVLDGTATDRGRQQHERRNAREVPAPSDNPSQHAGRTLPKLAVAWRRMRTRQKYRMRTPSTGREIVIEAEPDRIYIDRETGEVLEVVGELLPLAPTASELPWAVDNLRFCNWCDQLNPKDLNDCTHCGRRMDPLEI
jgi:hypothetical protein